MARSDGSIATLEEASAAEACTNRCRRADDSTGIGSPIGWSIAGARIIVESQS